MFNLNLFSGEKGKAGTENVKTSTFWTTPWSWRTSDGIYVSYNRDVWLYRELETSPLKWEDGDTKLQVGTPLNQLLVEIGGTSKDIAGGMRAFSRNREIHLLSITWEAPAEINKNTTIEHKKYLNETLDFLVPHRALLIGVKLRTSLTTQSAKNTSILSQLKGGVVQALGESVPSLDSFENDINLISGICMRHRCKIPDKAVTSQMESWYNLGRGPDVAIHEANDQLYIDTFDTIEMAAVMKFESPVMYAPGSEWMMDALTHPEGPSVVSIRGELEPPGVVRARLRRSQRKVLAEMEEEAATKDLDKAENSQTFQLAQEAENFFASNREPLFTNCSILMGRRTTDADETYIDELRNTYGIEMKPLPYRQLAALDETLPCSEKRINPFLQDVSIAMLAHAGLQGFSNLGDKKGLYVGLTDPDYGPCWLDTLAAPDANLPPAMGIFGDPGSGKTFLCQMIGTQAALAGKTVIMINPKGFDSLSPTADLVRGETIKMTRLEKEGGYFDPFRFASPEMAAEILTNHILGVLENGFTQTQRVGLTAGLRRGALAGARCAYDALEYVSDKEMVNLIKDLAENSSSFALGIGQVPQSPLGSVGKGGFTLIEFDRKLQLPESGTKQGDYSDAQRIALSAIRIVTRASLEILSNAGGGVFILDEAWTFLSSSDGLAMVQQLGREGRSMNILPIFATQRVADLLKDGVEVEGYMSRVFVMKLTEDKEARAALKLCGLEATDARLEWLKEAGPLKTDADFPGRPAYALHRDLFRRHAAVMVGPVPEAARIAFSTNPNERNERERVRQNSLNTDQLRTSS